METTTEYQAQIDKIREIAEQRQQEQESEVAEILRIFGKTPCHFFPFGLLDQTYNEARRTGYGHVFGGLSAVYMAGYVAGIRAERSRRNKKSPTTAATGGGAGQEDTKQATDIIPQNQ